MEQCQPSSRCPRCGADSADGRLEACPLCLLEPELPSTLAETYELYEKIGEGGMGTVYRARHRRLDRTVALKFLAEPLASRADFQDRIEAEGQAMARLEHPHIVAIYDLGRSEGHSYIVMEYVDGIPLSRMIPLPMRRALEVADQVCQALAYAHRRGIAHCDVKPQNILVDSRGQVKVSDFGIARVLRPLPLEDAVSPRLVMGTRAYMAPEARHGASPDPRMDVYSLGVILHEMVTGRVPVPGNVPSGPLGRVLRKALCPDPEGRYAGVNEMRRDLARVAESAVAYEAEPPEARRIRTAAGLLSLAGVVTLQALHDAAQQGLGSAATPWGPLLVGLGGLAIAVWPIRALGRIWREARAGAAPPEYVPLDAGRVLRWSLVAVLAFSLQTFFERQGPEWASGPTHRVADLLGLVALFWACTALLDAYRVGQRLGHHLRLLILGLAPSLAPLILGCVGLLVGR